MDAFQNNQNDPSLGRGLESLIPKKSDVPAAPLGASSDGGVPPAAPQAVPPEPAVRPDPAPQLAPERELPPGEISSLPRPMVVEPTRPAPKETEVWAKQAREKDREKVSAAFAGKPAYVSAGKMPDAIFHIEVEKIRPNPSQPRRVFDEASIRELASSIREFGLLQPIVVTKLEKEVPNGTDVEYILISGERRLHAVKLLGMERVPAIIRNVQVDQERLELAIIENLQRENLNPVEMARAFARLADEFRLTQREIATRLGKSRETIANTMRLLDLPEDMRQAIEGNKISESHGRLLLTVEDPQLREKLFRDLLERGLTTRELQNRARMARGPSAEPKSRRSHLSPELQEFQAKLSSELGTPVKIEQQGDSGKITISFYSEEELKGLLHRLGGAENS